MNIFSAHFVFAHQSCIFNWICLHLKGISDPLKPLASCQTFSNLKLHSLHLNTSRFCVGFVHIKLHFIFQVDLPLKPHRRSDSGNTSKEVLYVVLMFVFWSCIFGRTFNCTFYHTCGSNSPEMVLYDPREDPENLNFSFFKPCQMVWPVLNLFGQFEPVLWTYFYSGRFW